MFTRWLSPLLLALALTAGTSLAATIPASAATTAPAVSSTCIIHWETLLSSGRQNGWAVDPVGCSYDYNARAECEDNLGFFWWIKSGAYEEGSGWVHVYCGIPSGARWSVVKVGAIWRWNSTDTSHDYLQLWSG